MALGLAGCVALIAAALAKDDVSSLGRQLATLPLQFITPLRVHEIVTAKCGLYIERKMSVVYMGFSLAHEGCFREAIP
jgi:hypothetical protein